MMNYPYNRPTGMSHFGFPGGGQPQAGAFQGMHPIQTGGPGMMHPQQQAGGQVPQIPAGSTLPGPAGGTPGMGGAQGGMAPGAFIPGQLPLEQSYIENILRLNLGKIATIYMTFENNREWNAKIFKGRVEAAGRDHIIISDPQTGMRYLLLMVNLDYITFDEELNYFMPGQITSTGGGR